MRTPWDAIYAFYLEHRRCGELDGGVDGARVWMTCECGGAIRRRLDHALASAPAQTGHQAIGVLQDDREVLPGRL
jgi:hypothetical protein